MFQLEKHVKSSVRFAEKIMLKKFLSYFFPEAESRAPRRFRRCIMKTSRNSNKKTSGYIEQGPQGPKCVARKP